MKNMENTKITYSNKEISFPLIWIIFSIIAIFIIFPFNILAQSDDIIANNKAQSKFTEEINNKQENNDLSIELGNIEEKEEIEKIEKNEETNVIEKEEIEEKIINQTSDNAISNQERIYTTGNGETYSIIGKLNIPSLDINYDILSNTSIELLKISLNRYWGSYPNEVGNMVVVGHNNNNNTFFSNLPQINIGDMVKITDKTGQTLDYIVYNTDIIDPYDNSCTSQLTDGKTEITLITCYYENNSNKATKRFIAKARAY